MVINLQYWHDFSLAGDEDNQRWVSICWGLFMHAWQTEHCTDSMIFSPYTRKPGLTCFYHGVPKTLGSRTSTGGRQAVRWNLKIYFEITHLLQNQEAKTCSTKGMRKVQHNNLTANKGSARILKKKHWQGQQSETEVEQGWADNHA